MICKNKQTLTKMIITMSPALNKLETIRAFVKQNITIFRINFSHGLLEEHKSLIKNLRSVGEELQRVITICLDTKGPEFRIRFTNISEQNVQKNDILFFTNKNISNSIFLPIPDFSVFKTGMVFYLDDGLLSLEVIEISANHIKGRALNAHRLRNNKKANFPGVKITSSSLTEADRNDLSFGVEQNLDVIFASFIANKENIIEIRNIVNDMPIYSKVESVEAINNIDDIIKYSDGIMLARGDLGVETRLENLFSVQKEVSVKCIKNSKPVICATQMLESMISNTMPLRSEVSDIGNAVADEYDACMLSGETAVGDFPLLCTDFMRKIIENAEEYLDKKKGKSRCIVFGQSKSKTCIVIETENLNTINFIYAKRLNIFVYVISNNIRFLSKVNMYRGVIPIIKSIKSLDYFVNVLKEEHEFKNVIQVVDDPRTGEVKTIHFK